MNWQKKRYMDIIDAANMKIDTDYKVVIGDTIYVFTPRKIEGRKIYIDYKDTSNNYESQVDYRIDYINSYIKTGSWKVSPYFG